MNDKLRQKFAEIDGRYVKKDAKDGIYKVFDKKTGIQTTINYDNETDLLRVVRLLDDNTFDKYVTRLILRTDGHNNNALKATAKQMQEALASALGVEYKPE